MNPILSLFPLNIVAFPGEIINLHIFEPRYKELINDSLSSDNIFGIPSYVKNKIEFGTSVYITKVEKIYEDGRMDIVTKAQEIFQVLNFQNPFKGKKYAKGEILYMENIWDPSASYQTEMIEKTKELLELINVVGQVTIEYEATTFDIAHKVGLTLDQEYELLQLVKESERQYYIINHLNNIIPILKSVEKTKEKIKMNGHFNNFDPLDF